MSDKIKRDARVNMRLPEELLKWAKEYAHEERTTVTQIFIDHLNDLKDQNPTITITTSEDGE